MFKIKYALGQEYMYTLDSTHLLITANILSRVDCSVYYGPASRACACVLLNSVFSFLTTHPATTSL